MQVLPYTSYFIALATDDITDREILVAQGSRELCEAALRDYAEGGTAHVRALIEKESAARACRSVRKSVSRI